MCGFLSGYLKVDSNRKKSRYPVYNPVDFKEIRGIKNPKLKEKEFRVWELLGL